MLTNPGLHQALKTLAEITVESCPDVAAVLVALNASLYCQECERGGCKCVTFLTGLAAAVQRVSAHAIEENCKDPHIRKSLDTAKNIHAEFGPAGIPPSVGGEEQ